MWSFLKGKKTYLSGIGSIAIAIGSMLTGVMDPGTGFNTIVTAVIGMSVRHGVG